MQNIKGKREHLQTYQNQQITLPLALKDSAGMTSDE